MATSKPRAAGGLAAVGYTFAQARRAGGMFKFYKALRSRNACKTCALGMGGQAGGMVNESGHFPSVCKKSMQAQASDMAGAIDESFFAEHSLEDLRAMTPRELEYLGRIAFPLVAKSGDTHLRRIDWAEAMDLASRAFRDTTPDRTFFYASGRSSNEAAFLLQLAARAYGCENIHNCSYYCHQASGVALKRVYGSGTASVVLDDLRSTDMVMVVGANPASNHPRLITELVDVRRRGGSVIVVNPVRELGLERFAIPSDPRSMVMGGSQVSDLYLQPRIGTDLALFKAILKRLIANGAIDEAFVERATEGWDAVVADLEATDDAELLTTCGLSADAVDEAARLIGQAERGIFCWAMGLTHHLRGVDTILALANLALARGWLGRSGAGLMPIRGHSNVQGVGSMGVAPYLKQEFAAHLEERYGIAPPSGDGQDTFSSMNAAHDGEIDAAFLLGGNLFASNPDRAWAREAMSRIGTKVYVSTTMNEGHVHPGGDLTLILPCLARDEEPQPTTQESMFNFVRLSDGGTPHVPGSMRSEVAIIGELAERILGNDTFDWSTLRSHAALRSAIAGAVPGYEAIGGIEDSREEFQIGGRTFHSAVFATESGRARFHVVDHDDLDPVKDDRLTLMTIRSEGQFNTVVFEEEDLYRGIDRRDVILMSRADAERIGVSDGERVRVEGEVGSLEVNVVLYDITPGAAAMYYPEANALVPRRVANDSRTPAFKGAPVTVVPLSR